MNVAAAANLLHLIAAEPTLLLAAPHGTAGPDLTRRARDESHICLGCGNPATAAIIVNAPAAGPRWLDLCSDCWYTVRLVNDRAGLFQRLDRTPDISEFEADLADAVGE
ncbi:hypothetical protein ACFCY8_10320 [Streptomyces noursei]|uniref:hypothetical protein n=1 Tax=Streptomyces noursei TaxID=1971 RepID=UPI0035DDE111